MSETVTQPGLVIVAIDPADDLATLRAWYEQTKIPAVLAVPGVVGVKRWEILHRYIESQGDGMIIVPAPADYVVIYELADVTVARSDAFLDAIGRDFSLVADVDGKSIEFEQVMSVTLGELRDAVNPGVSSDDTRAMLVVSITPERDYIEKFHAWYDEEHVGELMSCPGFIRTRRYKALDGVPNFFSIYELDSPDALQTDTFKGFSGRTHDQLPPIHQGVALVKGNWSVETGTPSVPAKPSPAKVEVQAR